MKILTGFIALVGIFGFKTVSYGQNYILWEKTYGGSDNNDRCFNMIPFLNSGYLLTGMNNSPDDGDVSNNHGAEDGWLVRIDFQGNILMEKSYGINQTEYFYASCIDSSGNIISVGCSNGSGPMVPNGYGGNDVWIIKTDSMGNILWNKVYGGNNDEVGYDIVMAPDGSVIVAAVTRSFNGTITNNHGLRDIWLLRLSANDGSIIWQKCFGGSENDGYSVNDSFRSVSITTQGDSTFAIVGFTDSNDGDVASNSIAEVGNVWFFKIDVDGNILMDQNYGGSLPDIPYCIETTRDGGYIIGANSRSNNGDLTVHYGGNTIYDAWVIKVDSLGAIQWQKTLGGNDHDDIFGVAEGDEGYYLTGRSWSSNGSAPSTHGNGDIYVYYLDTLGDFLWSKNFGTSSYDEPKAILWKENKNVLVAGSVANSDHDVSFNHGGGYDWWVFEMKDITAIEENHAFNRVSVYPNPVNGNVLHVTTDIQGNYSGKILDVTGKIILNLNFSDSYSQIDISSLSSGIYFLEVEGKTKKFVLER